MGLYYTFSNLYQTLKPAPIQKHLLEIQKILKPGDVIILRNYIVEKIWPGYWSHAGLYVGTVESKKTKEKRHHQIIQARGNGVHLLPLSKFLRAKYAAILRPKVTERKKIEAVQNALKLLGRRFDFLFNFGNKRALSCVELIYTVYKHPLKLKLHPFMGKGIFTADAFLEKGFEVKWVSNGARKHAQGKKEHTP